MNTVAAALFLVSALALLGSPGPGIAALVAIGRTYGFAAGLQFFFGLQLGLAAAAALTAGGLMSLLSAAPGATKILTIAACVYLSWLAWRIATSPVGAIIQSNSVFSFPAGLALGILNPKAYLAFFTLFASQSIISGSARADAAFKWLLTVVVIILVDIAWLYAGARLGRIALPDSAERKTNVALGGALLAIAVNALHSVA